MSNSANSSSSQLPSYITSAVPNPPGNRAPWFKNTAPTYAGIFLWFVFWQDAVNAPSTCGGLAHGVGIALLGIALAALICHFLFYLVPGLLGQQTGLPLYIVGTSTFGATGGFLMPGFLMGLLQFGWLGVNIFFSSGALAEFTGVKAEIIMVIFGVLAAFVGLKGIQYVAKVATYLPLIPIAVLVIMFVKTVGGVGSFDPKAMADTHFAVTTSAIQTATASPGMHLGAVIALMLTYIVGFFATAGAAGVDFGTNSRHRGDVQMGGLMGIALAIMLTTGLSALIVAGVHGSSEYSKTAADAAKQAVKQAVFKAALGVEDKEAAKLADEATTPEVNQAVIKTALGVDDKEAAKLAAAPTKQEGITAIVDAAKAKAKAAGKELKDEDLEAVSVKAAATALYQTTNLIKAVLGEKMYKLLLFLLAVAAFPPACFSSFIAANSFKTTLPKVNPFLSVGIGAAVSIILAVTHLAGQVIPVFVIIGASFGPICGAMMVDYLLSGGKWSGPRAGFNPAGWIAWALGFVVGILPNFGLPVPAAPVAAFVIGAVVYFLCAKLGMLSSVVPLSQPTAPAVAQK